MSLSNKRKKFWAECLDLATTPEEDMLIKTIFQFIEKQDKEAVKELKKYLPLTVEGAVIQSKIDEIFGEALVE